MAEMNRTKRAAAVAQFMRDENFRAHRGAVRLREFSTAKTHCYALFGNDGYAPRPEAVIESGGESNADKQARTMAYVHGLYAGWANLLPEGAVEFGTDEEGYSWAILLHLPKRLVSLPMFLRSLVWDLWHANVPTVTFPATREGGSR